MMINNNDNTNAASRLLANRLILNDVYDFLGRFISYPSEEARIAHTLWIAHTHLMDAWENTPRIAFLSPEPASGKTRALEVTQLLVPNPVQTFNATPAYIIRRVGATEELPTILIDEIDTVFGDKAKRDNEELRGLINAGHRKGATAGRCVTKGNTIVTEDFPAYCAVAMAGLGDLPDTILTRSVIVRMRKRKQSETVEPFRQKINGPEGDILRAGLADWCDDIREQVTDVWPEMPAEITDRNADVWEPLLAIADVAGGMWPEVSRQAAVALVTLARRDGNASLGVRLLRDLRTIFGEEDRLATTAILQRLWYLEELPWGNIKGEALNDRLLAHLLKQYEVERTTIRIGGKTMKGYLKRDFHDAWERYLPANTVTDVTDVTLIWEERGDEHKSTPSPVTDVTDVTLITNSREGILFSPSPVTYVEGGVIKEIFYKEKEESNIAPLSTPQEWVTRVTEVTDSPSDHSPFGVSDRRSPFTTPDMGNIGNTSNTDDKPDFGEGITVNGKWYPSWAAYDNDHDEGSDSSRLELLLVDELEPDFG